MLLVAGVFLELGWQTCIHRRQLHDIQVLALGVEPGVVCIYGDI